MNTTLLRIWSICSGKMSANNIKPVGWRRFALVWAFIVGLPIALIVYPTACWIKAVAEVLSELTTFPRLWSKKYNGDLSC